MQASRVSDGTVGGCDMHIPKCCPHGRSGVISTGSNNVFTNGMKSAYVGSRVSINCPHGGSGVTTNGSKTVFINGRRACRINDGTVCSSCGVGGNINSGSMNVLIGG